jgi:hypothetical protein
LVEPAALAVAGIAATRTAPKTFFMTFFLFEDLFVAVSIRFGSSKRSTPPARAWIEASSLLEECFRFVVHERGLRAGNDAVLKRGLVSASAEIHSSPAGVPLYRTWDVPTSGPKEVNDEDDRYGSSF